jgi:hypothetical protein
MGVTAGGARYDATWCYQYDIPRLEGVRIDGSEDDWGQKGFTIPFPKGRGFCRVAWNRRGMVLLTTVPKGFFMRNRAWTALRAMLVNPRKRRIVETCIHTGEERGEALAFTGKLPDRIDRHTPFERFRSTEVLGKSVSKVTRDTIIVEALFPWDRLGIVPETGGEVGFQTLFFNPAHSDMNIRSGGGARRDALLIPENLLSLRLSEKSSPMQNDVPYARREWLGAYLAFRMAENTRWNGEWRSAARVDEETMTIEAAVPYTTLEEAGLERENLLVNLQGERTRGIPRDVFRRFESRAYALQPGELVSGAREYGVRLYFAEFLDVAPGERVFDVAVFGKTILKDIDVVKEAGGRNRALVKEIEAVAADKLLTLEFIPKEPRVTQRTAPIVNGIGLYQKNN